MDFTGLYAELKVSQELACLALKPTHAMGWTEGRQHHTKSGELCAPTLPAQREPTLTDTTSLRQ